VRFKAGYVDGSYVGGVNYATEWSDGSVIKLGACQAPGLAKRSASVTPDRRPDSAFSSEAASITPPNKKGADIDFHFRPQHIRPSVAV
jgi:hypothetical protein